MRVDVIQEDIDGGLQHAVTACMVARALQRITRRFWIVGNYYASPDLAGEMIPLPLSVTQRIIDFDRGYRLAPFTFEFDYAQPVPLKSQFLAAFRSFTGGRECHRPQVVSTSAA